MHLCKATSSCRFILGVKSVTLACSQCQAPFLISHVHIAHKNMGACLKIRAIVTKIIVTIVLPDVEITIENTVTLETK